MRTLPTLIVFILVIAAAFSTALFMGARLMHFHICSATMCYVCFIACVVINIGIAAGKRWSPFAAISCCESGLLTALITIISGSIWAYEAWGTAWVWEPRLTGMFLMTLVFVSWRLAIAILGPDAVSRPKLSASLIILGLPAMFFTHVATRLFGGIHPDQIPKSSSTLAPLPFVATALCIAALCAGTVWIRTRQMARRMKPKAQ
ncbi:MAG: hypothetical protein IJM59_12350 [Proteobacteria bacterium]|nr:hypothetical protein [Pseudomonadota bacterium]